MQKIIDKLEVIMYSLINLANVVMRGLMLVKDKADYPQASDWSEEQWEKFSWIFDVTDAISMILWPLLIVVASAGSIYAVILGVNMARADSTEKREEAKKRLINVLLGIGIIIGLILFLQLTINVILPALL